MQFSIRIINLTTALCKLGLPQVVIAKQIMRSGTSIGANYREACLAKSQADFINKIKICEAEADETAYWLELLKRSNLLPVERLTALLDEVRQLTAIMSSTALTAKNNLRHINSIKRPNLPQ